LRTGKGQDGGADGERTGQGTEGGRPRALAPYKSCWHYSVRPGTQLVARPETRYRSPLNADLSEAQRPPRPPASSRDRPPSPALTLPRATRVFLIRARFFRLIESYGFADERRRGNALPEIVSLSRSLALFFSARAESRWSCGVGAIL